MNKIILAAAAVAAFSLGAPALAQAGQVKAAPVDFRACNFNDGKTMKDLDRVTAKFRDYANKSDFDYAAWILVPEYQNQFAFDFAWMGAWPDAQSFGLSMEKWKTTGRSIYAEFAEVMDCRSSHQLAMSLPINAPEGTPEDGVLMFYACDLEEGKSVDDAYAAHLDLGTAMKGLGSLAVSWMFQPAIAGGDVDYYHVVGFYRYSDMGATMELYANGGGIQKFQKHLGGVSSCKTPTVFDAVSVRARDER